jgi:hypothetical protein
MARGIGLDFTDPSGSPQRISLGSNLATLLVPGLATQVGATITAPLLVQYRIDTALLVTRAQLRAFLDPDATDLAQAGIGSFLGIDRNAAYVKTPLASYVDPPLPWPASTTAGPDAERATWLARTFHRAHAVDWCNRFRTGDPGLLDIEALRSRIETLRGIGVTGPELEAACEVCLEFGARHLRVGEDETDYDTAREPLCHFLAEDPASAQYVYRPGTEDETLQALAADYCDCGVCRAPVPVAIHEHFERFSAGAGEIFFDKTVDVTFTGGTLLLSDEPDGTGSVFVDDELIMTVTRPDLTTVTLDHDYSTGCAGRITHTDPQDVTALFQPGVNHVRVQFKNTCGGNASAGSYWLVQCGG